jgi:DNA-binding PucR family transcriptional regulator
VAQDGSLELLRLLADSAPTHHLDRIGAESEAHRLARAVAVRAENQHRREGQLRALVDTARDLAAARDPSSVLDAIVRRARTLMGADVSYLTLYDPERGDTYMRATDGAVAPTLRSLRLELGTGLGGLVASTLSPRWSTDYPHDDRFAHTATIDTGVRDEGLVAICGTPLVAEGEFVGVLFAAHRTRHAFTQEEVALLGSLADLAAVSMVQARAHQETARALDALSAAHDAVRQHTEVIERSAAAHDRFTELIGAGGGVDDLTTALVGLVGGWAVLADDAGTRRSAHGQPPGGPVEGGATDPLADTPLARSARASGRLTVEDTRYAVPVRAGHHQLGTLVGAASHLDAADWRIVERAAAVSALVLLFERDTQAARQRRVCDLVTDLLAGALPTAEATRVLRKEGLDVGVPICVVVMRASSAPVSALVLAAGVAVGRSGIVGEAGRTAVALVAEADPGAAAARLTARLRSFGEVTAAGVGPVVGVDGIPDAFGEARRTLDAMLALDRRGESAAAADLGFAGLVVASAPDIASYVERVLGPVVAYDRDHGADLVKTLEAYFAAGGSSARASEPLHVHVNTVVQRLNRIGRLLGADWDEPNRALEVQLALRLRRLLPTRPRTRPPA